jgi:hypothetical protein
MHHLNPTLFQNRIGQNVQSISTEFRRLINFNPEKCPITLASFEQCKKKIKLNRNATRVFKYYSCSKV